MWSVLWSVNDWKSKLTGVPVLMGCNSNRHFVANFTIHYLYWITGSTRELGALFKRDPRYPPPLLHCSHSDQWTETQQITVVEHNLLSKQNTCNPAGATMPSLCYNNCIVLCSCRGSKQSKKKILNKCCFCLLDCCFYSSVTNISLELQWQLLIQIILSFAKPQQIVSFLRMKSLIWWKSKIILNLKKSLRNFKIGFFCSFC